MRAEGVWVPYSYAEDELFCLRLQPPHKRRRATSELEAFTEAVQHQLPLVLEISHLSRPEKPGLCRRPFASIPCVLQRPALLLYYVLVLQSSSSSPSAGVPPRLGFRSLLLLSLCSGPSSFALVPKPLFGVHAPVPVLRKEGATRSGQQT